MKKEFKKEFFSGKACLFDETTKTSWDSTIFTGRKKLAKKEREKCLADLGSGSETEYQSAKTLCENQDNSSRFLDYLIECCEKDGTCLNPYLCWSFVSFLDKKDERILPAIIKSFSKCPDKDLGNYVSLLGLCGGQEAKEVLKARFYKLKDNPQAFAKQKNWNDLGFSLLDICETLLKFEPDNTEAAECLVKFLKHPNSFNKEIAFSRVGNFLKNQFFSPFYQTRNIFHNAVKVFFNTNKSRILGPLLPYLFQIKPEKTYQKFKKVYLKTKKEERYNHLASSLIYSVDNSLYWICKLVRELPYEDSEYFREYLNDLQVKSISGEELLIKTKESLASESPNTRISTINKLQNLSNEDACKILEEALIDEPDDFIRKQFKKHLKKLKKNGT